MKFAVLLLPLLFSFVAQADLLERVRLEEALRTRVENSLRTYDEKIKVDLRFEYKKFSGMLPGTSIESTGPVKVEADDIQKIIVDVYSSANDLSTEAKDLILQALPVEKSKVNFNFKQIKTSEFQPVNSDAIAAILRESVKNWSQFFAMVMAGLLLIGGALMFLVHQRQLKEFKLQLSALTTAISESSSSSTPTVSQAEAKAAAISTTGKSDDERSQLEKMPAPSLKELFADCYWCEEDGYAAWLWLQITNEQRKELLGKLPFMKVYSLFFQGLATHNYSYHQHPYYLDPSNFSELSQETVCEMVKADSGRWHQLSPMRQQSLPLSFEEKLAALQTKPSAFKAEVSKKSEPRVLNPKPTWGEVSISDEHAIFQNPAMVPESMRVHVKSLVWLAQRDDNFIQNILTKYDARGLASAWIGPDEVLKKLESQLPEKKLKLLQTYRGKTPANRKSPVYLDLVEEGLKNAA